jgi:predicted nuclease of predicted toxin-antitoxin system
MTLLFDEQLSEDLCVLLADVYPAAQHVRLLGRGGATDEAVWQLAHEFGCTLVSKDEDFHRLCVLRGAPPKLIWIRLGNCTNEEIAALLRRNHSAIVEFDQQAEAAVLELG